MIKISARQGVHKIPFHAAVRHIRVTLYGGVRQGPCYMHMVGKIARSGNHVL